MDDLREKLIRLIVLPETSDRTREAVVDELLAQQYRCADCAKETGGDGLNPAEAFAWRAAPRYRLGVTRQGYCRRHQSIRNSAAQRERLKDKDARKAQTERTLQALPQDPAERSARRKKHDQLYSLRHREARALRYRDWVERNPEKRKASQDEWRARQRHRMRPAVLRGQQVARRMSARAARIQRKEPHGDDG
jgi:hypothetical protein